MLSTDEQTQERKYFYLSYQTYKENSKLAKVHIYVVSELLVPPSHIPSEEP